MREVFCSPDSASASVRQALLQQAGIQAFVQSENLSRSKDAFIGPIQVKLCVGDADYDEAMEVLRALDEKAAPDWICPACQESVPGSFDSCWKCQEPKPGVS